MIVKVDDVHFSEEYQTISGLLETLRRVKKVLEKNGYRCGAVIEQGGLSHLWIHLFPGQNIAEWRSYLKIEYGFWTMNTQMWEADLYCWPRHGTKVRINNDNPGCQARPGEICQILERAGIPCLVRPTVRKWVNEHRQISSLPADPIEACLDEWGWVCLGDKL